jgi:hypothetical protein
MVKSSIEILLWPFLGIRIFATYDFHHDFPRPYRGDPRCQFMRASRLTARRMQVLMNTQERISNIARRLSTLHLENLVVVDTVGSWIECNQLEVLTLDNPGRAILDILPRWLEGLQGSLRELHARVSQFLGPPSLSGSWNQGGLRLHHSWRSALDSSITDSNHLIQYWDILFYISHGYSGVYRKSSCSRQA